MKIIRNTKPVEDDEIIDFYSTVATKTIFNNRDFWYGDRTVEQKFLDTHAEWIKSSKLNSIKGLDSFSTKSIIAGCTEALIDYQWAFRNKRLRFFAGEYVFNPLSAEEFTYMHDDELREGDALIISAPFAFLGDVHPEYEKTMEICTQKNIPVLVDCCMFGSCYDIDIKVDYPCVVGVCFSLSKSFASGRSLRVGTLFSNKPPSHLDALNFWGYTPQLAARVATELMNNYTPDFLVNKYKKVQEKVCNHYNIKTTKTMFIGIGDYSYDKEWPLKFVKLTLNGTDYYKWGLADALVEVYREDSQTGQK